MMLSLEPKIQTYLFGSIVRESLHISDVDLLLIYREATELAEAREVFLELALRVPLHVVALTESEERELSFVHKQGAVKVRDWTPN